MAILPQNTRIYLGDSSVTLTPKMKTIVGAVANGESPMFVSGKAGTGKSTLLRYIQRLATKPVAVLGPTGVAAVNAGGMTVHSFFRLPPRLLSQHEFKSYPGLDRICRKLEGIIVDEISMVRADLLDAIDASLKLHRENREPFGGVQMIMFGDLAQLPPVVDKSLEDHFSRVYESPFFFDAHCLRASSMSCHDLEDVLRQRDHRFIDILNRVSEARSTPTDLQALNQRVDSRARHRNRDAITLTTTNRSAKATNKSRLDELPSQMLEFRAEIHGRVEEKHHPTNEVIEIRSGARVMVLTNNGSTWNNGTLATVTGVGRHDGEEALQVEIRGTTYSITRHKWEIIRYVPDQERGGLREEVIGTFRQFPVKLAWAVTIHKSQGLTFENVVIDMDRGAFAHGQLYVALSRCRSLEGISLVVPIRMTDLQLHPRIDWFQRNFM